jgi:hypothetical protein
MTTLEQLRSVTLIYLATPYSKYTLGLEVAFRHAAHLAARLLVEGLNVYSPIVHGHPISVHGSLDPLDHSIWLPFNAAIIGKSNVLLVARMDGWDRSFGIAHEITVFGEQAKPVHHLDPATLTIVA